MITAQVVAWMAAIQSMMLLAPDVIRFAAQAKQWVDDLFGLGLISAEAQNALHARVTAMCRATLNGDVPDHWKIEADPEVKPDSPQAPV